MIVVIGGGISGLAVGYSLQRAGAEFVVLESASAAGGVVASVQAEGRVLELGPQRTRLTPPLRRLVAELGLDDRLLTAPELPLFVHVDGRLREVPLGLRSALTTDLIGWRDRLRLLLEPLTGPLRPGETSAEFFIRKFGRRTYDRVIAPVYGGLYASDPAEMPARHALAPTLQALGVRGSVLAALLRGARAAGRSPSCSFDGGLQVLTDALATRLGDRLERDAPARAIHRGRNGLHVVHERGELRAEAVVLACPADAAATILAGLDPDAARGLAGLSYNRLAVVHLLADAELHGHGYQVALDDPRPTHGVAWNHSMFGRRGLYTAFLGGARRPLPDLADDALAGLAADDFHEITGAAGRPVHVHRTRMPAWDTSWERLDGVALDPGVHVCANWWGRPGIAGRLVAAERLAGRLIAGRSRVSPLIPAA
jgi:protoporphyrinogen/coproporphyrinogen III oxidase